MVTHMLTTVDNPYDPFEQFSKWLLYDVSAGYNSCDYLARVAHTSSQLSEKENNEEIERAIDEIIRLDILNVFKKVSKNETVVSS